MEKKYNKIINNLSKADKNYEAAKIKFEKALDHVGWGQEIIKIQKKAWEGLAEINKTPMEILDSAVSISDTVVDVSNDIYKKSEAIVFNANSSPYLAVENAASLTVSAGTYSFKKMDMPNYYSVLRGNLKQKMDQNEIILKLKKINPNFANKYENAWKNLHTTFNDPARSPLFLIREVIRNVFDYYAPEEKLKTVYINKDGKVHRADQISYIIGLIKDERKKEIFISLKDSLTLIYKDMSYAHAENELNVMRAEDDLYRASNLIKIVLEATES